MPQSSKYNYDNFGCVINLKFDFKTSGKFRGDPRINMRKKNGGGSGYNLFSWITIKKNLRY